MKRKIAKCFVAFMLLCSFSAYAVAPLLPVVYFAAKIAGAALLACAVASPTGQAAIRNFGIYAGKVARFEFHSARNVISSPAYAIPEGTQTGVRMDLETPKSAVKNQIKNNPSQYPQSNAAIQNAVNPGGAGISQGSWGIGSDFDLDKAPKVGDIITTDSGDTVRVTSVGGCTTMAYSRKPGFSMYNAQTHILQLWTGCNSQTGSAGGPSSSTSNRGVAINTTPVSSGTADDLTDEQWDEILSDHPDDVVQAQKDIFNNANGNTANLSRGSKLPGNASTGQLVLPGTDTTPTAGEVLDAVDRADAVAHSDEEHPAEPLTTETHTTRVRGEATVSIDEVTGARTVTIPTTVTVTDAAGNIISQHVEYFVGTYPAGVTLPDEIAAAIDGVTETTTTDSDETTTPPPPLTKPDLASVDFTPLLSALNILQHKFPFAIVATITSFVDSWYVEPRTPEFTAEIAGQEFTVSLSLLDSFALWWRRLIGLIIIICAAYSAVHIAFR